MFLLDRFRVAGSRVLQLPGGGEDHARFSNAKFAMACSVVWVSPLPAGYLSQHSTPKMQYHKDQLLYLSDKNINFPQVGSKWVSPLDLVQAAVSKSRAPHHLSFPYQPNLTSAFHLPIYFPLNKTLLSHISLILIILIPVSLDTAIAISFGILSAFISLISVLISYLTLRATTTNQSKHNFLSLTPLSLSSFLYIAKLEINVPSKDNQNPQRLDEYGAVLRHEHTHFTPQPYTSRQSERRELRWRE